MEQQIPKTLPAFFWTFIKMQPIKFVLMFVLPQIIDIFITFQGDKATIFTALSQPITCWIILWIVIITAYRAMDINEMYLIPKFRADVRMKMFSYTELHSHKYFADNFAGSIAHKVSDMSNSGWNVLFFLFRNISPVLITVILAIASLYFVNPIFSYILFAFFIAHMGITIFLSKETAELSKIHSESRSFLHGKIVDSLTNMGIVRAFARNKYEKKYLQEFQNIEAGNLKSLIWLLTKTKFWLEIPSILMMVSVFYYLIKSWQSEIISTGDVVFIISVASAVMHNIWRLGIELPNFYREIGVCKQALSLINQEHEIVDIPNANTLKVTKGEIVFNDVHFNYRADKSIFTNKNVVIPSGQKVGLVGFSGSGKTTFVNLILRLYDLESGNIFIDEQDISQVTQDSLRENLSVIPQDTTLFHRTLTDNIKYGKLDATDDEVMQASKKAHCHEFVEELEDGYNSLVGERGIKLSGGQRQRIAIARAILKNAPILILDEATSSLDSITEKYIQESLEKLMQNRTVIVVAHRLSNPC